MEWPINKRRGYTLNQINRTLDEFLVIFSSMQFNLIVLDHKNEESISVATVDRITDRLQYIHRKDRETTPMCGKVHMQFSIVHDQNTQFSLSIKTYQKVEHYSIKTR